MRGSVSFTGGTSGTVEVSDILPALTASVNEGFTIGPILYDIACTGTGTGTGQNSLTLGLLMGPGTLDAADLDPSANPNIGWWYTRKFYLQNNSNPAGEPWLIQGGPGPFKVATKRKVEALSTGLFVCALPTFAGFTAVATSWNYIATVWLP